MTDLTEDFIRRQIRKLINEESKESEKSEEPKTPKTKSSLSNQEKVFSNYGPGRLPKELSDLFKGADGSSKKGDRLAYKDPARLMKNLKVSAASGSDDKSQVDFLLNNAIQNTDAMSEAFLDITEQDDGKGRWGLLISTKLVPRTGTIFIHDTLVAAQRIGHIKLDDGVRVDSTNQGILVYKVESSVERWAQ